MVILNIYFQKGLIFGLYSKYEDEKYTNPAFLTPILPAFFLVKTKVIRNVAQVAADIAMRLYFSFSGLMYIY